MVSIKLSCLNSKSLVYFENLDNKISVGKTNSCYSWGKNIFWLNLAKGLQQIDSAEIHVIIILQICLGFCQIRACKSF